MIKGSELKMTSYFYIQVTDSELCDMMKNGSTNQKIFIDKAIKASAVEEVFNLIESLIDDELLSIQEDIRGAINGGILFLTDKDGAAQLSENDFIKYEITENLYLIIELAFKPI